MYYLDTSLIVTALAPEPRSGDAQKWLGEQSSGTLFISAWVETEFSSALSMKLRMGSINLEQRDSVRQNWTKMTAENMDSCPIREMDFKTASRFIDQHETGLRPGDALHLAVALSNNLTLATLDQGLARAGKFFSIPTRLV